MALFKKLKSKRSLAFIAVVAMLLTMLPAEMLSVFDVEASTEEAYVLEEAIEKI